MPEKEGRKLPFKAPEAWKRFTSLSVSAMRQAATVSFLNRWPHRKIKICLFSLISDSLADFCKTSLDLDCKFCFDSSESHSRLQTLQSPRNLGISIYEVSIILSPEKEACWTLQNFHWTLPDSKFFLQSSFQTLLSKIFLVSLIPYLDSQKTYSRKSLPTALPLVWFDHAILRQFLIMKPRN